MDATRFDEFARALSTAGTRRGLLGLLVTLPLLGEALAFLDLDGADAAAKGKEKGKGRRKRRGRGDQNRELAAEKKRKKKKKCKPPSTAITCAGKCGPVTNTCKKTVNCGACVCNPNCAVCLTCQPGADGSGACVLDPQQQGDACGAPGQVCQADGSCRCDVNSCPLNENCNAGVCGCTCPLGCTADSVQTAINNAASGATITLCPGRFGPIVINKNLTLVGVGVSSNPANDTNLDAGGNGTVVTVAAGVTATQEKVRITGGNAASGGGIDNDGDLTLTECEVTGNTATAFGGGINNKLNHVLILNESFVAENEAVRGGGIENNGNLTLSNSSVDKNTASTDGGGIVNRNVATLNDSRVTDNDAGDNGGGIFNDDLGVLTLNGTSFVTFNTAGDDGGGIFTGDQFPEQNFICTLTLNGTSSVGNNVAGDEGGGIYIRSGNVTLNNQSGVGLDNSADIGGGIFILAGDLTLNDSSSVQRNTATTVGGIRNIGGTVLLTAGTLVCDNTEDQCEGFDEQGRCPSVCPDD